MDSDSKIDILMKIYNTLYDTKFTENEIKEIFNIPHHLNNYEKCNVVSGKIRTVGQVLTSKLDDYITLNERQFCSKILSKIKYKNFEQTQLMKLQSKSNFNFTSYTNDSRYFSKKYAFNSNLLAKLIIDDRLEGDWYEFEFEVSEEVLKTLCSILEFDKNFIKYVPKNLIETEQFVVSLKKLDIPQILILNF